MSISFARARRAATAAASAGKKLPVIGKSALVKHKQASGRTKDLLDIELLRKETR